MAEFKAFAKDVEVNGQTVLAVVAGMGHMKDKALQILAKNGITGPKAEEWYCQQSWLNAFKDIAEQVGPYALYSIGTKIPENARFPPGIDSLAKALVSIDIAYHLNHRGGEIGNYKVQTLADGSMSFICTTPYPCEFDRGILEGVARKFVAAGYHVVVKHDDAAPCRSQGGDSCSYHLEIKKKK